MYYYILICLSFISFGLQNLPIKQQSLHWIANSYLFFIIIFFISCFRYRVGTDFFNYQTIFEYNHPIEPLFYGLIQGVKCIGGNYTSFVAIVFTLSFGIKLYTFLKLSYYNGIFLCLMLFCSFYYIAYDINAIRQGLAISLTLLACYYAYIKRPYTYSVICITATLIHYTAFIFIPFYLLLNLKLSKKSVIVSIIICFILSKIGIFYLLINWASNILGNGLIAYKIQEYAAGDGSDQSTLISFGTIRRLFFFFLILFSYEKINAPERIKRIIFCGGFVTIIIYLLFAEVGYFATRLSVYYRIIECIWLSYFPFIFKKTNTRYIIILFYLFYSLLQVHSALSANNNNLLPIQTIFFKHEASIDN